MQAHLYVSRHAAKAHISLMGDVMGNFASCIFILCNRNPSVSRFGVISRIWQPRGNIDTFSVPLTRPCDYFGHIRTFSGLRPPK